MSIKRLEDMTQEELVSLSEEDMANLVRYECAADGLGVDVEAPKQPDSIRAKPCDLVMVQFDGFTVDVKTGNAIQDLIDKGVVLNRDYNKLHYDVILNDHYNYPKIQRITGYSANVLSANNLEGKKLFMDWSLYKEKKKEFDEWVLKSTEVADKVYSAVQEALSCRDKKESIKNEWQEYLNMANGDKEIAMTFFRKRYGAHSVETLLAAGVVSDD